MCVYVKKFPGTKMADVRDMGRQPIQSQYLIYCIFHACSFWQCITILLYDISDDGRLHPIVLYFLLVSYLDL